jgi:branched-chain amino acid transport system permease protein
MSKLRIGAGLLLLVVVVLAMPTILRGSDYWLSVLIVASATILMAGSLRTVLLLRQISLGHVGFALIGAYGSALLMMNAGLPFWLSLPAAGFAAAFIALLLSYPFLKVRGVYFSILTLLTAETLRLIAYYWTGVTGGSLGLVGVPSPGKVQLPLVGLVDFGLARNYYYIAVVVALVCMTLLYLIEHSHLSRKWQAIRDAEELSGSVGINVMRYKTINFTVACFFAGISGGLLAHYQHSVSADVTSRFGVTMSIYLLVYLVVGGKDRFWGPIVGTLVLTLITEFTRAVKEYQPMVIGVIAILVMVFMPDGLVELPSRLRRRKATEVGQAPAAKMNTPDPDSPSSVT